MSRNPAGGFSKFPSHGNSQGNNQNFRSSQNSSGFGGGNRPNNGYQSNHHGHQNNYGHQGGNNNFTKYDNRQNSNPQSNRPNQYIPPNSGSRSPSIGQSNHYQNGRPNYPKNNFPSNQNYHQTSFSPNSNQGRQNNVFSPQSHQSNSGRHFGTVKPSSNPNRNSQNVVSNGMAIENENSSKPQNSFNKPHPNNTQNSGAFGQKDHFQRGRTSDNSQSNGSIWGQSNNQGSFMTNSQNNGSWDGSNSINNQTIANNFGNQKPWNQNNNQGNFKNNNNNNGSQLLSPNNNQGNLSNNSDNNMWNQNKNNGNLNFQASANNFANQNASLWGKSTNNTSFAPNNLQTNPITNTFVASNTIGSMTNSNPITSNPNPKKFDKFKSKVDTSIIANNSSQNLNLPAQFGNSSNIFSPFGNSNNSGNSNNGFGNQIGEPMRPRGENDAESAFARRFWNDGAERLDKAKLYNNLDEKKKNEIIDSFLN